MKALVRATVLSMGLWTTASCLVTDDLEPREVIPEVNRWPRIVEESVTPPNWTVVVPKGDVECSPVDLVIGKFADENLQDDLYVRLFANYDPEGGPYKAYYNQAHITPSGQVERGGYTYEIKIEDWCKREYVFKVLVADGQFDPGSSDFDAVLGADRGVASYEWTVDLRNCSNASDTCQ